MSQAEQVVRDLATAGGQRKVLKQLGNFKPQLIANANASFARFEDGEVPLVFYDRSFFLNGKAGVLVTDRAIYSSNGKKRLPLAAVQSVQVQWATLSEKMNGKNDVKLIVNGQEFYTQLDSMGSNSGFLKFVAEVTDALRKTADSSAAAAPGQAAASDVPQDPIQITAGAICAGQSRDEILRTLAGLGMNAPEAAALVDGMTQLSTQRDTAGLKAQALGGAVLAVVAFAVAVAVGVLRGPPWMMFAFQGVCVAGIIMLCTGGYRLLFGSPPVTAVELAGRWRGRK